MGDYRVVVCASQKYEWALRPFAYFFSEYWPNQPATIITDKNPPFKLGEGFEVKTVDVDGDGWPLEKWAGGLIKYLHSIPEQFIVILLEDYWLRRPVDKAAFPLIIELMRSDTSIMRFDLMWDRMGAHGAKDVGYMAHYDLVEAVGSQYQMSLWPGMWNKGLLLEILHPGWTPWQVELEGTNVFNQQEKYRALGTRQAPLRITNVMRNEKEDMDLAGILPAHIDKLKELGWLP